MPSSCENNVIFHHLWLLPPLVHIFYGLNPAKFVKKVSNLYGQKLLTDLHKSFWNK